MIRNVEAVEPALLIEAHQVVTKQRGRNDSSLILVGHFFKRLEPEAMLRAAAITPLSIDDDQVIATLTFDRATFIKNALAESEPDGNA